MISFRLVTAEFFLLSTLTSVLKKKKGRFLERPCTNLTDEEVAVLVKMLTDTGEYDNVTAVKHTFKGRPATNIQMFLKEQFTGG